VSYSATSRSAPAGCRHAAHRSDDGGVITISQPRGTGASGCRLDPAGLAEAAGAVARAIDADVALLIVNKFSKQEALGQGLRGEIAQAVAAGVPVLTAVPNASRRGPPSPKSQTTLPCARRRSTWWAGISGHCAT
jgi:molybdate transport system ATP-binding protein